MARTEERRFRPFHRYLTVALGSDRRYCHDDRIRWKRIAGICNDIRYMIVVVAAMTAGSAFLMWIGEEITEYGVGNGISIVLVDQHRIQNPGRLRDTVMISS